MIKCLVVGMGGFIGAICRYLCGLALASLSGAFPLATLLINLVGSLLIGGITEFSLKIIPLNPNLLAFLTVGICGGFTTFSTFSLETFNLFEKGKLAFGVVYVLTSVLLCLVGIFVGKAIVRSFVH